VRFPFKMSSRVRLLCWLVLCCLFAFLTARNVLTLKRERDSFEYLRQRAFREIVRYSNNPTGKDPRKHWAQVFLDYSKQQHDSAQKARALQFGLAILVQAGSYEEAIEVGGRIRGEAGVERLLGSLESSYFALGRQREFYSLLEDLSANHRDSRTRAFASIRLTELHLAAGKYASALQVIGKYPDKTGVEELDRAANGLKYEATRLRPGMHAPDFAILDGRGRAISSHQFAGSPLIILFWSPGCKVSTVILEQLLSDLPTGFKLLTVAQIDDRSTPLPEASTPNITVCYEPKESRNLSRLFNVRATPTILLINSDSTIWGRCHSMSSLEDMISHHNP
jgi:hypothetical protein